MIDSDKQSFNLVPLLAGSEGTLAITTELTLKVVKIPAHKSLVAIFYDDFIKALEDARALLDTDPHAVETVDSNCLALAKEDEIYHQIRQMLPSNDQSVKAMNLVEWVGHDPKVVSQKAKDLCQKVATSPGLVVHLHVAKNEKEMTALWNLRKKSVGLLGNMPGDQQPVPFIEDTVVPPDSLAQYIKEFRAALDRRGLKYGMFGHVDVGCLHVRPALNLQDPKERAQVKAISLEINQLVKKYQGLVWAEHGKGFRSEFIEEYMGPTLYPVLKQIKKTSIKKIVPNTGELIENKYGGFTPH